MQLLLAFCFARLLFIIVFFYILKTTCIAYSLG